MHWWITHNLLLITLLVGWMSYSLSRRIDALTAIAVFYFMMSGVMVFMNPYYSWTHGGWTNTVHQLTVNWVSAQATLSFLVISLFMIWLDEKRLKKLWRVVLVLISLNCLVSVFTKGFLFHADSMDAAVGAMMLPMIWKYFGGEYSRKYATVLTFAIILSITHSGGATAWVALVLGLSTLEWRRGSWSFFLGAGVVLCIAAFFVVPSEFFNTWGRERAWLTYMTWWKDNAPSLWGTGLGTLEAFSASIEGKTTDLYTWLHNDYLQVLFETGVIGLVLALVVWGRAIWRARRDALLFASLSAASIVMMAQFPLRFGLSQLVLAMLVKETYEKSRHGSRRVTEWLQKRDLGPIHRPTYLEAR